jgi:hypothetical protein
MRLAHGLLHFGDSQDGIYRMHVGLEICLEQFCPKSWRIGQRKHSLRCMQRSFRIAYKPMQSYFHEKRTGMHHLNQILRDQFHQLFVICLRTFVTEIKHAHDGYHRTRSGRQNIVDV